MKTSDNQHLWRTATSIFFATCFIAWSCECTEAQVVQLPAYRSFSYAGGALVPDGGVSYLGGSGYFSQGSISRGGPFLGSRSIGFGGGVNVASVSVNVIDLDALDEAILSANVPRNSLPKSRAAAAATADDDAERARQFISNYRSISSADEPRDYRDFQRTLASRPESQTAADVPYQESLAESNVRFYLAKGREAENANRIQSARVFYRLALEAMTPQMLQRYQSIQNERDSSNKTPQTPANSNRKPF